MALCYKITKILVLPLIVVFAYAANVPKGNGPKPPKHHGRCAGELNIYALFPNGTKLLVTNKTIQIDDSGPPNATFICEYQHNSAAMNSMWFTWKSLQYRFRHSNFQLCASQPKQIEANRSDTIFRSEYQSKANSFGIQCAFNNCTNTVFFDAKKQPIVKVFHWAHQNIITCQIVLLKGPVFVSITFGNDILYISGPAPLIRPNVYQISVNKTFWGLYSCTAKSAYGTATTSTCVKPKYLGGEDGDCKLRLRYGFECKSSDQCITGYCHHKTSGRKYCDANGDCVVKYSTCKYGTCKCPPKTEQARITSEDEIVCVKLIALHHFCDERSTCVNENSVCLNRFCTCSRGYYSTNTQCVKIKDENRADGNLPMIVGVSVCAGVFIMILVIMLIMKRARLCELVPSPEERQSGRIFGSHLRNSLIGTLRRNFRRTPPPSYSRATKPPSYQEAMQMQQEMPNLAIGNEHFALSQENVTSENVNDPANDSGNLNEALSIPNEQRSNDTENGHDTTINMNSAQSESLPDNQLHQSETSNIEQAIQRPEESKVTATS